MKLALLRHELRNWSIAAMRIEGLEDKQISWMLKPLTWMMKRRFGKVLNPFKALGYRPGIRLPTRA